MGQNLATIAKIGYPRESGRIFGFQEVGETTDFLQVRGLTAEKGLVEMYPDVPRVRGRENEDLILTKSEGSRSDQRTAVPGKVNNGMEFSHQTLLNWRIPTC